MSAYLEQATEQRCADFRSVRDWVFAQIDHNLPQFAHDIAEVLACPQDCDQDAMARDMVSGWYDRMSEVIATQPQTAALAAELRETAAEEAREAAEDEALYGHWYGNPYLEACHDQEVRAARRAQARLDEAERESSHA